MKLLHTSDWHIGKQVNGFPLLEDQRHALAALCAIIREERPHALIIAGDIYDRAIPPVEAVRLLNEVLQTIVLELATPVIAIAGNHDSNERLDFGAGLLGPAGLHLRGMLETCPEPVIITDEHGPVQFFALPYADPALVRERYGDELIRTHDDAMARVIAAVSQTRDPSLRAVAVAHGYVIPGDGATPLEECESEKPLVIGGTAYIDAAHFDAFAYTALGHLHRPQSVRGDRVRYAGSLMPYSFSEATQPKGVTLVDIGADGAASARHIPITPRRAFRIVRGTLEELLAAKPGAGAEDYLRVILTDDGEVLEPMQRLRAVYPHVMEIVREESRSGIAAADAAHRAAVRTKSPADLFRDFYRYVHDEDCPDELAAELVRAIAHTAGEERR